MNNLSLNTVVNDCPVTIKFDWYGEEPSWDTMEVIALLPSYTIPESKMWVRVNNLLSDKDWDEIETAIYENETELYQQRMDYEY